MNDGITLGVLGAGAMARAIVEGVLRAERLKPSQVVASRRDLGALGSWARETGVRAEPDNSQLVSQSDLLMVGLKPQGATDVLRAIAPSLSTTTLVISLAAGLDTVTLERALPPGQPVLRLMPNTPCLVGRGAIGLCLGTSATDQHAALVSGLIDAIGQVWSVDESLMDTITAVSGSGPAYVFYLMEAMEAAAVRGGLDPAAARQLVAQTVLGSAELAVADAAEPATLRARVTSPGGTTAAAIAVLDDARAKATIEAAVAAGIARGAELREDAP